MLHGVTLTTWAMLIKRGLESADLALWSWSVWGLPQGHLMSHYDRISTGPPLLSPLGVSVFMAPRDH